MMEFVQASRRYSAMSEREKKELAENIAESLMFEQEDIREAVLAHFGRVDENLEKNLRERLTF